MTTLTELETIIIAAIPALTSIVSIISAICVFLRSLSKLKDNQEIKAERDALVKQNEALLAECRKMRKQTALFIEKASHVLYKDMTEVKNDEDLQV